MVPLQAKVLLLGDSGVGKTSLRHRYLYNRFNAAYKASIGADFVFHQVTSSTPDKTAVNMQILDAAGQERFRSLAKAFYRGADAVVMVFSATDPSSLSNLRIWFSDFVERVSCDAQLADIAFVAVCNKSDLPSTVSLHSVMEQLNELLPGSTLAQGAKVERPPPQPVPPEPNTTASRGAASSLVSSSASTSIYHTPQGSMSTLTPGSVSGSSISTIRVGGDDSSESGLTPRQSTPVPPASPGPPRDSSASPQPSNETTTYEDASGPTCRASTAFTLFYTSAKTGASVADPFQHVADQLALRLQHKRETEDWWDGEDERWHELGRGFTLKSVSQENRRRLDRSEEGTILPTKQDSQSGGWGCC